MANLGPQKINLSYPGLLQVSAGLTASLQNIQDGAGNASSVQISTSGISAPITTDSAVITGGSINGTVIGNVNPATASFTSLTVSGTTTLGSPLSGILKGSAGTIGVATAGTDYVSPTALGVANGVATLDASAKLTASQIPSIAITSYLGTVASQAAMLALTGQEGDWCIRSDLGTSWVITGTDPSILANWTQLAYPTAPVISVNGFTGAVNLTYSNVGAAPATTGSSILYANGSGGFSNVNVGTGLSFAGGTLSNTVTGTVSLVSVVSANGFTGSVTNASTTPAITIATSVTGVLKGNGTAISAAVSGTDYAPATFGTSILKGNGSGGFSSAVSNTDYQGVITATGLLKGAGAGSISAAVVGTDYAPATTGTAILKGNSTGGFANAVSGTDYAPATSGTSLLKGNGSGGFSNAVSGTDYAPATSGTSILYGNGSGGFSNVTVGSGLTFTGGTLASVSGGGGTVTNMSIVTANGFAGTVATSTTTPAVTMSTTVIGMLKGDGTAISAATAGSDYPGLASNNTYTGNQVISVNSSSNALRITQTGAGNALVVEDSANPDSSPFVVDASGFQVNGYTAPVTTQTSVTARVQTHGLTQGQAANAVVSWQNGAVGSSLQLSKSRGGVIGTQTAVQSGDGIGGIDFSGSDGIQFIPAASISAAVDGTPGTNDMPGRLVFSTTKDGASSPTEAMRIDSGQRIGIGTTPSAGINFRIGSSLTGATTAIASSILSTVQSDVTTTAIGYISRIGTAATSFTVGTLNSFRAEQATIGAGSAVTNQYGYFADSSLTGATNNYGFYSNIASGTGRYNFYAAGTADNYFAGKVGIAATTSANAAQLAVGGTNTYGAYTSGVLHLGTFGAGVSSRADSFLSYPSVNNTLGTLDTLNHFFAAQATISTSVTNQHGFRAESNLTGATNNYGFYSNIASGTGRWNFYAAGTAANYFAGNTTIAGDATLATVKSATITAANSNTVEATSGPTSSQLAGNRNKIINGAMMIDQRNAGASVTPNNSYTLDRWVAINSQTSKFSVQQNAGSIAPPAGFRSYLGVVSSSAYSVVSGDYFGIRQSIEGYNIADLSWGTASASAVTLSFWVRSSITGTFGGAIQNNASTRFYAFSYSVISANTWEYKTINIAGDTSGVWNTDNTAGIILSVGLGVGSTYSVAPGSWGSTAALSATGATSVVGTNGATFYITGVQLEKSATATPFENRLYGTELALCQRYYWSGANGWAGVFNTASTARFSGSYPVEMRSAPTITAIAAPTAQNPTVSESQTGSQTTGFSAPASGGSIGTTSASKIQFGGFSSGADGRPSVLTNSPLAFSSEL